jgi:hypothetical protein
VINDVNDYVTKLTYSRNPTTERVTSVKLEWNEHSDIEIGAVLDGNDSIEIEGSTAHRMLGFITTENAQGHITQLGMATMDGTCLITSRVPLLP